MSVKYFHIKIADELPNISTMSPFKAVVIADEVVSEEQRALLSRWLVQSGCFYMMAWGKDCSSWDDAVDWANMEMFDFNDIPNDHFVMTTWHDDESLKEVFHFSKNSAHNSAVNLENTLLLHISNANNEVEILQEYVQA